MTYAQSDEINISAAFRSFIDLRVTDGANVDVTISTLDQYKQGVLMGYSSYEVSSSNRFSVNIGFTPISNAEGDELDLKNLTYQLSCRGTTLSGNVSPVGGTKWDFGSPNTSFTTSAIGSGTLSSGLYVATSSPYPIILPGPDGNAGSYDANSFNLPWRLGWGGFLNYEGIKMPSLLDQNIAPGTYTCTVTLEAIPEAL